MTILGILFVLGIAFLASMNFEADMIVSESQRARAESRVTAVGDQFGSTLRDGLMSDSRVPFGNPSAALSATAYAEMPGVQNSFSSVEPNWHPGPDNILNTPDDLLVFSAYADAVGLRRHPYAGPSLPHGFAIDTSRPNGANIDTLPSDFIPCSNSICTCATGLDKGNTCTGPADCAGLAACEGPRVLDADGDGIVDSIMVDASLLDFSDAQLAALSARLNPASNPTGRVYVGMRVLPHGGLVNLNASHPKLIENVLDVPDIRLPAGPAYGNFYHRPTLNQVSYSPLLEESSLRRRGLLAPRSMSPSWLHGDPLLNPTTNPWGKSDMAWQLYPPKPNGGAARGEYDTVFDHRYFAYTPTEPFPGPPNPPLLWAVRMEPFTADPADGTTDGIMPEYDRRHLVTTVSHDDLLARGGRVPNPAVPGGEEDILTKMTQANQADRQPGPCPALLPFEYSHYPKTIPDDCCPADYPCRLNARKGRLQLSLPYLDDRIDEARLMPDSTPDERWEKNNAFERVYRLIYDTFFLLVRNAAHVTTLEGTPCSSDVDCAYAYGACGASNRCNVGPIPPPNPFNCTITPCSIPGSVCRTTDGVCTIQAPYWQDATTATACNAAVGEVWNATQNQCLDVWTGQTRSQALVSRTAAALTANLIDYADLECLGGPREKESCSVAADCPGGTCEDRGIPSRVAIRSMNFVSGVCIIGPVTGNACEIDLDCGGQLGSCSPPQRVCFTEKFRTPFDQAVGRTGNFPVAPPVRCNTNADCAPGDYCASGALQSAGREFHFGSAPGNLLQPKYVYGLERQPYITEVATFTVPGANPGVDPTTITARGVEIFNPHETDIDSTNQYYLYEVDPTTGMGTAHQIPLFGIPGFFDSFKAGASPFTTFASGDLAGLPINPTLADLTTVNPLQFMNGWTLYLVRRYTYPGEPYTEIVVDQFEVAGPNIAKEGVGVPDGIFSVQRMAKQDSPWTATVPKTDEMPQGTANLGDWNTFAPVPPPHPVEVNFANLGSFSRPFNNPVDPRHGSVSFPTTGSLLMLMRHANRSLQDYTPPSGNPVNDLAFTTRLIGGTTIPAPANVTFAAEQQIDNGRMPVFDEPVLSGTDNNWYSAHHLAPFVTQQGEPGNLDMLPWGQLVFDYFTALPLSSPGPYFPSDPTKVAAPDSKPRVDLDGLRVHGRININAAPWKVLAGLPFIPLEKIPVPFKARMRRDLGFVKDTAADSLNPTAAEVTVFDNDAARIGTELAQAIVAYRDLRQIPGLTPAGTGNYATGMPTVTPPPPATAPIAYARGWQSAAPTASMARRGTGFMSVGELANVRHLRAEAITPPLPAGFPKSYYRIDAGFMDVDPANNNTENFVEAVATLVALGDWVTVRSQVFTVYGVLRGQMDPNIVDPVLKEQERIDLDSRALRFQETIDRLPTFLGEPVPSRIGDRSLTRYTDVHND
jgi:hypothetical protein